MSIGGSLGPGSFEVLRPSGAMPGLSLTGAVVRTPELRAWTAGRNASELGIGVVLDGRIPSAADVIDLGSGAVRPTDVSQRVVVLDWIPIRTLSGLRRLVDSGDAGGADEGAAVREVTFAIALRILRSVGFHPLTRPTLIRVGFRDLCRDLDPHEGQAIRVRMREGRVVRIHLDCENVSLILRTGSSRPDPQLEESLLEAFPSTTARRFIPFAPAGSIAYRVSLPSPASLVEVQETLDSIRSGILEILARFEPERWETVNKLLETFGHRATLAQLLGRDREARSGSLGVPSGDESASVDMLPAGERVH